MAKFTLTVYVGFVLLELVLTFFFIYSLQNGKRRSVIHPRDYKERQNLLVMWGCPIGWPLQISVQDEDTRVIRQVCRKEKHQDWKCAKGWQRLEEESRCMYSTEPQAFAATKISGIINNSSALHSQYNRSSVRQPKYAPVSDQRKLLFIHVPMTGGTSIETSFLFDDKRKELSFSYLGGHNKIIAFDEEFFKSYHKFGMVRHPCSRLISTWSHYSQGLGNARDRRWVERHIDNRSLSSFHLFVTDTLYPGGNLKVTNSIHLQPQVDMLFDRKGHFALNQLLIFEKWNESFDALSRRIHEDLTLLKATRKLLNMNTAQEDCQSIYTLKEWEKMTKIYAMDFCVLGYSSDINKLHEIPSVDLTADNLTQRYKECADTLIHSEAVTHGMFLEKIESFNQGLSDSMTKPGDCTIYTYYELLSNAPPSKVEMREKTVNAWKVAWSEAGWTPRVLTEEDSKTHPDYVSLRERFWKLPTVNNKEYEVACFMRYVAMAAVGGGWMSDYDLIPFHFPSCTKPFNDGIFTVYMFYTPSLVSGNSNEFTRVANLMADVKWKDHPRDFSFKAVEHVSDMHIIRKLLNEKEISSMKVVMEARQLLNPFSCENSLGYKSIPKGMSSLPWAIHFSHNSIGSLSKSNLSSFWPGSVWNSAKLTGNVEFVRHAFMTDAARYLRETCLRNDNKTH